MTSRLEGQLELLDRLARSARSHTSIAESENVMAKSALAVLRQMIRDGDSTGDRLYDYVLLSYGDSLKALGIIKDIDTRVREHPGELVLLVVNREESAMACTGFGGRSEDSDYHMVEEWVLAVIDGPANDGLCVTLTGLGKLSLPCGDKHILQGSRDALLIDRGVSLDGHLAPVGLLDVEFPLRNRLEREMRQLRELSPPKHLQIFIGNDEVEQWAAEQDEIYSKVFRQHDADAYREKLLRLRALIGAPAAF